MTGKVVVGVDIGSAKIATVVAKIDDEINVLGVSEVVSEGIRKGQIVDIKKAVDSITTSLDSAERMAGYSISRVVASIGGGHIESQNSRGAVAVAAPPVVAETEKELGVIVADIGAGTTDISLYYEGSVAYSSVLPIGARHITNDIAIGLRISLESAEKIKLFLSKPIQGRGKNIS